jgi:predicted hydrocarbon binding protein
MKERIPNSLMYVSLVTLVDILGQNGLNALLNYGNLNRYRDGFPPNNDKPEIPMAEFICLIRSMIDIFGERGTRTLLHNAGRKSIRVILEKNPALLGLINLGLKALSPKKRAEKALTVATKEGDKIFGIQQKLMVLENGFKTEISDCFWCKGLKTKEPICSGEVGFEAELIKWATGGAVEYDVREVTCIASGDASCTFLATEKEKAGETD